MAKYYSIRVVDASSEEEATRKVENGDFDDRHPLCDKIVPATYVHISEPTPKSRACSKVLQLMDEDYTYTKAIDIILACDKRLSKTKLEKELNKYI